MFFFSLWPEKKQIYFTDHFLPTEALNEQMKTCVHVLMAGWERTLDRHPWEFGIQYLAEGYLSRTLCLPVSYWLNYHCPIWPLESNLINDNLCCGAVRLLAFQSTWTSRLLKVCVWCFSPLGESLCCHWSTVLGMPCYHMSMLRDGPKGLWGEQNQQLIRVLCI